MAKAVLPNHWIPLVSIGEKGDVISKHEEQHSTDSKQAE